ncbi:MAG: hypothetical protein GXO80_10760 [Chlorobi bacterium]|nr:hypothetical protein [Chlorobiota bacterium]
MVKDIGTIETKTENLISSYTQNPLSDPEAINLFLDNINKIRKPVLKATDIIREIDKLILLITWVDVKSSEDEQKVKEIIQISDSFHKDVIKVFAWLNKNLPKRMFGEALKNFKNAVDDLEDSINEVEQVIFVFRKDKELTDIIDNL